MHAFQESKKDVGREIAFTCTSPCCVCSVLPQTLATWHGLNILAWVKPSTVQWRLVTIWPMSQWEVVTRIAARFDAKASLPCMQRCVYRVHVYSPKPALGSPNGIATLLCLTDRKSASSAQRSCCTTAYSHPKHHLPTQVQSNRAPPAAVLLVPCKCVLWGPPLVVFG